VVALLETVCESESVLRRLVSLTQLAMKIDPANTRMERLLENFITIRFIVNNGKWPKRMTE
jgi:hypothetical protein